MIPLTHPIIMLDVDGEPIALGNPVPIGGHLRTSFSPDPWSNSLGDKSEVLLDSAGSLQTRGPVHTDEGSFRDHFAGSSLATSITGTLTFTNGSTTVTGSGSLFTEEFHTQYHIKRDADGETAWVKVAAILSDTELELDSEYAGSSGSGAASVSLWIPKTASGGSISVSASAVTLTNGLANSAVTDIFRLVDYGPLYIHFYAKCGTRVANQLAYIGLVDVDASPSEQAVVLFDPALGNTQIVFKTSLGGSDEETTVTLPNAGVTTAYHRYEITQTPQSVTLHIDSVVCAKHTQHIPGPYTVLYADIHLENTSSVGSSNSLYVDWFWINNANRIEIANSFLGEPLPTQLLGKNPDGLPQPVGVGSTGGLYVQPTEGKTFQVTAEDVVIGNNKSMISLHLNGASSQLVKLRAIYIVNSQNSSITGIVASLDLRRFTSHSSGSNLTPTARDSVDVLPGDVTAKTNATISGASSRLWRWNWSTDEWGAGTLDTEGLQVTMQNLMPSFSKKDPAVKPWVLRPGEGYDIICSTNSTSGSFDITFVFTLEDD